MFNTPVSTMFFYKTCNFQPPVSSTCSKHSNWLWIFRSHFLQGFIKFLRLVLKLCPTRSRAIFWTTQYYLILHILYKIGDAPCSQIAKTLGALSLAVLAYTAIIVVHLLLVLNLIFCRWSWLVLHRCQERQHWHRSPERVFTPRECKSIMFGNPNAASIF